MTADASISGIRVIEPVALKAGEHCEMSFKIPLNGMAEDIAITTQSVFCGKNAGDGYAIGMRFIKSNANSNMEKLYKFIEETEQG